MDHHCSFLNNCVGARNQKFFILYIFVTLIATLMSTTSSWIAFKSQLPYQRINLKTLPRDIVRMPAESLSMLVGSAATVVLCLLIKAQLTVLNMVPPTRIMGENRWTWPLPTRPYLENEDEHMGYYVPKSSTGSHGVVDVSPDPDHRRSTQAS